MCSFLSHPSQLVDGCGGWRIDIALKEVGMKAHSLVRARLVMLSVLLASLLVPTGRRHPEGPSALPS